MAQIVVINEETGIARRTVQKWCKLLQVPKHGRDYAIGLKDEQKIRSTMQDKSGRPRRER